MSIKSAPSRLTISTTGGRITLLQDSVIPSSDGAGTGKGGLAGGTVHSPTLRKFMGDAYSGATVDCGFGAPLTFDLSGMKCSCGEEKKLPILRQHDANRIVGYAAQVDISASGVKCAGMLCDTPSGQEVAKLSDDGFNWQMSVGLDIPSDGYEGIDDDIEAEVNGRRVKGPMLIARKSKLREISFVPLGADENTSAFALASEGDTGMVPVVYKENQMAEQDNKVAADAVAVERKRTSDIKAAFPTDLAHAMEHIEKGSSLLEAQAAHAGKLTIKLAEQEKEMAALKAKATTPAAKREAREPVATASAEGSTSTVKEDWNKALGVYRLKGKTGIEAAREVAKSMPALHAAFLAESQIVGATRR